MPTLKPGDMLEVCDGRGGVMVGELLDGGGGGGGRVVSIHPAPVTPALTRSSVFASHLTTKCSPARAYTAPRVVPPVKPPLIIVERMQHE